jgi:hypothetical protein
MISRVIAEVMDDLLGPSDRSFTDLEPFLYRLRDANPGSRVDYEIETLPDGRERFLRAMYMNPAGVVRLHHHPALPAPSGSISQWHPRSPHRMLALRASRR